MKKSAKTMVCLSLSACMLFSSAAATVIPSIPSIMSASSSITASAVTDYSQYLKNDDSWFSSSEAISVADDIVNYQLSDGGWRKDMTNTSLSGSWAKSTIDNGATHSQIRILAKVYNATGTEKYKTACLKGIDCLLKYQYSNGGWPQVFNDAGTYHAHITYNDTAMVSVLRVLQDVANKTEDFSFVDSSRQSKAKTAVDKGIECILDTQITINGTLTAWCQQHDENTLEPTSARAYELPSVCTSESVGIVDFLRTIPDPDARIVRSINAAVKWFDSVKIENIKFDWNEDKTDKVVTTSNGNTLWARFYDLEESKPLFSDRDGQAYDDVADISLERRTGYAWYGNWPAKNVALGTLPEPEEEEPSTPTTPGTHIYVGYSNQSSNYNTVQEAVNAAAKLNPSSEDTRVSIHIAPGTYREQIIVNTPYISFINDNPSQEVKLTWYYGIGYEYYSMGSDGYYSADAAASKSAKGEANRWGSAVGLKGGADYFRAEYITFENSFNRYITDEEIADGVAPSGSQSITFERKKGVDVTSKTATERAAAIAVEGDFSEFYQCTFLGSQDTLFTKVSQGYFRECHIEGNTDYIFGQGDVIFQDCELEFAGYSDKAVGGYITAKTNTGKYLFYNCDVTAASGMKVGSGYFGRPWSADADVAFVNTKLSYEDLITAAGWSKMSNNSPENANFKEYNTTANGKAVDTSGRVSGTVRSSGNGLDVDTYLNGWVPYYYDYTPAAEVVEPINGELVQSLTPKSNALPTLWKIDTDLQVGDAVYTDRDMTYTALPEALVGAEAIVLPCDAKSVTSELAAFTANGDITVYVAYDSRMTAAPAWVSGWKNTGLTVTHSDNVIFNLYSKDFKSGETVTLGSNGQTTGCKNYTVLVTEDRPDPISGSMIQNLTPKSEALPTLWQIDTSIQVGDPVYTDRDMTYAALPEALVGAEAIVLPCDAKAITSDLAVFTANGDFTVYAALDSRMTAAPSWISGWNNTGLTVTHSDNVVFNLYSKDIQSGETVTLGSNGQTTGCKNYTVFAAKGGIQVTGDNAPGDLNSDNRVNVFDMVIMKRHISGAAVLSGKALENADVNGDKNITIADAVRLQSWLVGKNVTLFSYGANVQETVEPEEPAAINIYESADFQFSGKVFVVGDSTVCNYDEVAQTNQNRCGWGMKIAEQYNGVTVTNLARAGRSSRSFLVENEYKTMCNSIGKGDYLFVQFGHNDEKTSDADRGTYPRLDFSTLDSEGKNSDGQYSYEWILLNKYVKVAQEKGATVVLVSPVTRRGSNGTANYESHVAYAEGLVKLGKEYNIPVIDMTTKTAELYTELYNSGGADATAELHCYTDDTRTAIDNTHLSIKGCTIIAEMIAEETGVLKLKISEKMK